MVRTSTPVLTLGKRLSVKSRLDSFDRTQCGIDTYRSGVAGGQHVGLAEVTVRVTHMPTGIVKECSSERSQHKSLQEAIWQIMLELEKMDKDEQG